ncbi:MAG: response regulator [Planctomycetes bacterium]|nr:response regulator [Planctomycetota bacterium]
MKLSEFPAEAVKRAIEIYLEIAWGKDAVASRMPKLPDLEGRAVDVLLDCKPPLFKHEPPQHRAPLDPSKGRSLAQRLPLERRVDQYLLELGNPRFLMMKLVLGEHLIIGEYFLQVDTHEWMFTPDAGDPNEVAEFAALKAWNADLKRRIEARWNAEGLPTLLDLFTHLTEGQQCAVKRRGQRVLVVDDDLFAVKALAAFLGSRGYDVDVANDGEAGLAVADAARHQLIILDCDMPKLTGPEVCARLQADPARASIPVLLSSLAALGDKPPPGATAFLIKPFQADVLLYFVEALAR